jgi:hypothetical protein
MTSQHEQLITETVPEVMYGSFLARSYYPGWKWLPAPALDGDCSLSRSGRFIPGANRMEDWSGGGVPALIWDGTPAIHPIVSLFAEFS